MSIPAAGFVAVNEMMEATECFYETLRLHIAVYDFFCIELSCRGQQTEQFVEYIFIALHMFMRAIHLPKKRDDL